MSNIIAQRVFVVFLLALGLHAAPAHAQIRVFVSAHGSDNNACSFTAPCRTFQQAHNVVAAKGEIDVLDPAGYGSLTIIKAISIQGHGVSGIAAANGGIGMVIAAGAGDAVYLSGLLFEGNGVGAMGIRFAAGKSLVIENCVVRNFFICWSRFQTESFSDPLPCRIRPLTTAPAATGFSSAQMARAM